MPSMSSASRIARSLALSGPSPPEIRPFTLMMSVATLMPGGTSVRTNAIGARGLVAEELVGVEIDAEALGIVGPAPGDAGEMAHHGAVLGRDLAEIGGADQPAGAVDVLHDDVGIAVDEPADMAREQPALDVGGPAGAVVDQHREPLALVERLVCACAGDVPARQSQTAANSGWAPLSALRGRSHPCDLVRSG